ncbi:MAG: hypothetical protein EBU90_13960 [Proteobacteria bacterium]|nr:hypothetical protein [Pseudomonadota bacterium]
MLDLTLDDLKDFTDEEVCLIEEMGEMIEEMSKEELDDFLNMIELMGKKKKEKSFLFMDRSEYYH